LRLLLGIPCSTLVHCVYYVIVAIFGHFTSSSLLTIFYWVLVWACRSTRPKPNYVHIFTYGIFGVLHFEFIGLRQYRRIQRNMLKDKKRLEEIELRGAVHIQTMTDSSEDEIVVASAIVHNNNDNNGFDEIDLEEGFRNSTPIRRGPRIQ